MVLSGKTEYSSMRAEDLLGRPLNDVELKHVAKILYVKGTMEIPQPRPRVSIIGSRKASPDALKQHRQSQRRW